MTISTPEKIGRNTAKQIAELIYTGSTVFSPDQFKQLENETILALAILLGKRREVAEFVLRNILREHGEDCN